MSVPRRIVTGHDARGRSVVLSDGPTPRTHENEFAIFHELWNTRAMPAPVAPTEREPTERPLITPPDPNGTIVRITVIKAGERSPMHRTQSIDYGIVLEGEIWLVLDDGSETRMRPGDVAVQRGTDHAWENRSDQPARIVFILVDGTFTDELRDAIGSPELWDQALD
ncbi:MAG TPA: cupin domain-containing protein [Solirubrobacter sp.]